MTSKAARRRGKARAKTTLPGGQTIPPRGKQGTRTDRDNTPPPILAARARQCPASDPKSPLHESDMGRCIMALAARDELADLTNAWSAISAALRNYRARIIGQTGTPQGAAIAMVPEPMETDPSLRVDLRTAEERDRAAQAAWEAWKAKIGALPTPGHIWAIQGALMGFFGEGRLWHEGKPTASGGMAVAALRLMQEK